MPRALIIDYEPPVRSTLRAMLEHAGFAVSEASEGEQGIRAYFQQPADLIFCDMFMAGKEGLETIMQMRRQGIRVPIVAMSGGTCTGVIDCLPVAKLLGATITLQKPFGMEKLRNVLVEINAEPATIVPMAA